MNFWKKSLPVHKRREKGAKEVRNLAKKSKFQPKPVRIEGRKITTTFWGDAWCRNLESHSDFSNRLPRGKTYVRNGSVMHLEIEKGLITGLVAGNDLYEVSILIDELPQTNWEKIKKKCSGNIASMVELLTGRFSEEIMTLVTAPSYGIFPGSGKMKFKCTCPDWASMCKHVAAVLYGVGNRLDHEPQLLFLLRGVDPGELIASRMALPVSRRKKGNQLKGNLETIFGIELFDDIESIDTTESDLKTDTNSSTDSALESVPDYKAEANETVHASAVVAVDSIDTFDTFDTVEKPQLPELIPRKVHTNVATRVVKKRKIK
ncbi:MAG: hypothetical protein CVV64_12715 [Candidatus Wallbacteria bacterium HGW-Wallbacteria-1]|jgi:uncharacterized Zn finger protein|uniref:SWIM-type domain-containing protein n=1 Tax=Candidatus Wallbacteria bacterium HGW-Wallbacteria-1 TaxID=2013854 RepID=A0A2N1PND9_9BACT|nr:MAG: hypothetical protein CVV64_12715 [Candidatus Wallbacteria bacterium HGW-Wallbacteria-1]